jgi:hypothetical protein
MVHTERTRPSVHRYPGDSARTRSIPVFARHAGKPLDRTHGWHLAPVRSPPATPKPGSHRYAHRGPHCPARRSSHPGTNPDCARHTDRSSRQTNGRSRETPCPCRSARSSVRTGYPAHPRLHRAVPRARDPSRSSLLMNVMIGVSRNRHTSISLMVRSSTPLATSITISAESTAVRVR